MATFPGFTNPNSPPDGNLGHFPPLGNVGAPYMETLSLPGLTVGLPVWLFSTSLVPHVQISSQPIIPPPKQHQHQVDPKVDPKVDPFPSSPVVSSSLSSSFPGESLDSSNQEAKKKKKNKQRGNEVSITTHVTGIEKPSNQPRKVKFP